jgi:midasin (ATPase involved in ribosome maturation)
VELHIDDIPESELETILEKRCGIPLSYAKKLVAVMLELQRYRQGTQVDSISQNKMKKNLFDVYQLHPGIRR